MLTWDERKKHYDAEYYDGEESAFYGVGWWTADIVWQPKAKILNEAFSPSSAIVCGCAKGSLVKALEDLGIDAYGFDLSEYAITSTPFADIKDKLLCHDLALSPLPFPDKHFDLVVSFDFLEHQDDEHLEAVCKEVARLARKNILIRQPFTDLSNVPDLRALYASVASKPHYERMQYLKAQGIGPLTSDDTNVEHPNTRSREEFLSLFPAFREIYLQPPYYDMNDPLEPVLPFFDTMALERKM